MNLYATTTKAPQPPPPRVRFFLTHPTNTPLPPHLFPPPSDHLLTRGDSVVVIDELNDYYSTTLKRANIAHNLTKHGPSNFKFVEGDICDEELVERIFKEEGITHVCHLAARAGVRPR